MKPLSQGDAVLSRCIGTVLLLNVFGVGFLCLGVLFFLTGICLGPWPFEMWNVWGQESLLSIAGGLLLLFSMIQYGNYVSNRIKQTNAKLSDHVIQWHNTWEKERALGMGSI